MSLSQAEYDRLMADVRKGSEGALAELFRHLNPLVCNTIRKHMPAQMRKLFETADLGQIAWGTLFRHRSRLDRCQSPRALEAYIATVTLNKLRVELRNHRAQKRHNVKGEMLVDHMRQPLSKDPSPSQVVMAREKWSHILRGQPEHYQEIIRLVIEGHRSKEIAEKMGLEAGSVRRIRRTIVKGLINGDQLDQ